MLSDQKLQKKASPSHVTHFDTKITVTGHKKLSVFDLFIISLHFYRGPPLIMNQRRCKMGESYLGYIFKPSNM